MTSQVFNSVCIFSNDYDFIKSCLQLDIGKKFVFLEIGKIDKKVKGLIETYKCSFYEIDKSSLSILVPDADIGLMFGFGIKLASEIIRRHKNGVVNAHPGDLKLYRGRHPIGWALIEREPKITLTFHKITKDFDLGLIIKNINIQVDELDTEYSLIKKVRLCFNYSTFSEIFNSLKNTNFTEVIKNGRYLPPLAGKFDDIQSADFSSDMLIGISRAKFDYGGILLNGQKVGLLHHEYYKESKNELISFKCCDNRHVYANGENNVFLKEK